MADVARTDVTPVAVDPPVLPSDLAPVSPERIDDESEWEDQRVTGADLSGHSAQGCLLSRVELCGVLLTGAELPASRMTDVRLVDCELSGTLLSGASLLRAELVRCRMSGAVLADSRLRHTRFVECKLDEASFRFARLEQVVLEGCGLPGGDFTGASLQEVSFADCDLRRAEMFQISAGSVGIRRCQVEGLRGASYLKGAAITSDEVVPLSLSLLAELGITIDEE